MSVVTEYVKVDPLSPDPGVMARAASVIAAGGLVAFPTETVYGLGGNALDADASRRIYAAKGRPSDNPLIVHIADMDHLDPLIEELPEQAWKLIEKAWPGPLTVILPKSGIVPYETTGGLQTVAVRMPSHPTARAFIRAAGGYIAAPSANTSGRPSPTTAEHVREDLDGRIEMIIDGGPVRIGLESTIVDFTEDHPMILRPGFLDRETLLDILGDVRLDPGLLHPGKETGARPKAPGMRYRHYAPKAELTVYEGDEEAVIRRIRELARAYTGEGRKTGILCALEHASAYADTGGIVRSLGAGGDEEAIARNLFAALRDFDHLEADVILSEGFDTPRLGMAIMNRLLKAAGQKREKV